jgi:hypothetical protein
VALLHAINERVARLRGAQLRMPPIVRPALAVTVMIVSV